MNRHSSTVIILLTLLFGNTAYAAQRIAVLEFELNDISSLPNTRQEQVRTASIQPLLEAALQQTGDYEITRINTAAQTNSNAGLGYLFRFHEPAAKLGEQSAADWLIVGQHSKPSFLFSYLMVHVINVKTRALVASFDIELKGTHERVMQHGVRSLAQKIKGVIGK